MAISEEGPRKRGKLDRHALRVDGPLCLTDLPDRVINDIFLFAGDLSAIRFGSTCKSLRELQPPVRVLVIDDMSSYFDRRTEGNSPLLKFHSNFCPNRLRMEKVLWNEGQSDVAFGAYSIIESLPDRIASQITHIYCAAFHVYDRNFGELGGPALLLNGSLDDFGTKLSSLHTLVVSHTRCHTSHARGRLTLGQCLAQLCKSTSNTLRALKVKAFNIPSETTVEIALECLGCLENLNYLDMRVHGRGEHGRHDEEETFRVQQEVVELCPRLKETAQVLFHQYKMPWYAFYPMAQQWDVTRHSCLYEDPDADSDCYHPKGYSGRWCGGIRRCTEGVQAPPLGTVPTRMYPYVGLDPARFAMDL